MAQKSSDTDDQPNPSSSSTKDLTDSGSAHNNTPTPAQPSKPTNNKASGDNAAVSQPMTKSTSSGSNPSGKEAMTGPSPYGTRSRNRGQARPNYAEDKDVDVDMYDAFVDKKDEESKKSSRHVGAATNGTSDAPKGANSTSRKGAALEDGKASSNGSHTTTKDSHSTNNATTNGSSTTTSSSTTSSKKRKAPAQSVANHAHSNGGTPAPAGSNTTKRGGTNATAVTTTHNTTGYKPTNMLYFEKSGAIPKDGKMVADDGTVLEANGMNSFDPTP
ncbi:hypothetical protein PC116_g31343 [Phytophthora cactorum]|nr:hypothetical protein PC116_g31343 [Phytophthora cactorum]